MKTDEMIDRTIFIITEYYKNNLQPFFCVSQRRCAVDRSCGTAADTRQGPAFADIRGGEARSDFYHG